MAATGDFIAHGGKTHLRLCDLRGTLTVSVLGQGHVVAFFRLGQGEASALGKMLLTKRERRELSKAMRALHGGEAPE